MYRELNTEDNINVIVNWKNLIDVLKNSQNKRLKLVTLEYITSV